MANHRVLFSALLLIIFLGSDARQRVHAKVLFLAHYNGAQADADFATGDAKAHPVPAYDYQVAETTSDGRWGGALDISNPKRNCLYAALDNLDTTQGTVDFWYQIDTLEGSTYNPFFGWYHKRTQPDGTKTKNAFEAYRYGNSLILGVYDPYLQNSVAYPQVTGVWQHMAINWDCRAGDGASTYNVYLDGKHVLQLTNAVALKEPGGFLHLGIWDYAWSQNLRGRIDELRITDQIEHLSTFTPPTTEYPTPGTAASLAAAMTQATDAVQELEADNQALRDIVGMGSMPEQFAERIHHNVDLGTKAESTLAAIKEDLLAAVASTTGRTPPAHEPIVEQLGTADINVLSFLGTVDDLVAAVNTARRGTIADVGTLLQNIPAVHNDAVVDLAYLKDDLEGLQRAAFYVSGISNIRAPSNAIASGKRTVDEATKTLEHAADTFHGVYADAPGAKHDPVLAIPTLSADRAKRRVLQNTFLALNKVTGDIAQAREQLARSLTELQTNARLRAYFPHHTAFVPAPLPPIKAEPDGTLKRLVFSGSHGRTETMMALDFDTLTEESPSVTWETRDRFKTKLNAVSERQWEKYKIPLSDTVLLYAVGDNMYRPAWFADEYTDGPEYYHNPSPSYVGSSGFDYRHPVPRALIQEYLEEAARIHATKPYTFIYKGPWEAHPYRGTSVDVPGHRTTAFQEHGFSDVAVAAFRAYLENKYGAIDALNLAWGTNYTDFEDIEPPDPLIRAFVVTKDDRNQDVYTVFYPNKRLPGAPTTGLTYEFERCRKDLYADYLADCYQAIKRGDPTRPVASSTSGSIMSEILVNSLDDLQMPERCVDMWGKHPSGGYGWTDSPYMYGMNRYFNKTLVSLEYYGWAQEEIGDDFWPTFKLAPGTTAQRVYNSGRRDTWHEISWDRRMLLFYWTQKTVQLPEGFRTQTAPLVRPWAGLFPVTKRRTTRLNDIFFNVPIVAPTIGVVHPGVSIINGYPYNSCMKVTRDIFDRLLAKQYHFGVVPEKFIVNGRDNLDNYDIVILPYAQYFEDGFGEILLNWVARGGTLITAGPFGLYNKYGFTIPAGAAEVFPDVTFSYPTPQGRDISWQWEARRGNVSIRDSYLAAQHGRGQVLLTLDGRGFQRAGQVAAEAHVGIELGAKIVGQSTDSQAPVRQDDRSRSGQVESDAQLTPAVRALYEALAAGTQRKARVTEGNIEMVLRQGKPGGPLYMSLLNWDYTAPQTTEVVVEGEYRNVADLSIDGGFPVPTTIEQEKTRFSISFGPGEGLMLRLQ